MGIVVEDADKDHFFLLGDLRLEIGGHVFNVLAVGLVLADFGDEHGVLLLRQGLFHGQSFRA